MTQYIDKDALVAEIKRRMDENRGKQSLPQYFGMIEEDLNILSFIDTLEVKEVANEKIKWSPSKKQMESLQDMLKWNIGDFNYQKWMEVNSLYNDLIKMLDYETDRQG